MTEERNKALHPVVGALIINKDKKFLLAKSARWQGQYVVFGGHVEWSEALEDSVKREVKEEASIEVDIIAPLGFDEYIPKKDEKAKHYVGKHMVFLDFLCSYDGTDNDIVLCDEYEQDTQIWVTLEEALKLDLGGGTLGILKRYQAYLKTQEYLADLKRVQADFENYKKRQQEAQKELGGYLIEKLVLDIVPVLDNFRSATQHVPPEQKDSPWVVGIQYIEKQLETVLTDNGVQTIEVQEGEEFDPQVHEALSSEETKESESEKHVIAKVIQKGYRFGERVIRPAKVIVK